MVDTIYLEGRVGPQFVNDGSFSEVRTGKNGEVIYAHGKGRMAEASMRGELFVASTAVAGVAPGTALGTTPPFAIHNPDGSGILVSIMKVAVGYVSGTLGAGSLVWAENPQTTVPTGGAELTANSLRLGQAAGKAKAYDESTISGTPTILRSSGINFGASLATTALMPVMVQDFVDGEFIVPENQVICLEAVAAGGSTPVIMIGVTWQEIPNS